jgi:hypothetical protein
MLTVCWQAVTITCITYTYCCVYNTTPYDGQKTCPKHVDFYSKNKCEKLVHLVGFTIRIRIYCRCYWIEADDNFIQVMFAFLGNAKF